MWPKFPAHKEDGMYRPRLSSMAVFALLALAALTVGCSSPPEEALLRQFFRASQLRDSGTLSNFAAAEFNPRTEGVVTNFEIVNVSEERKTPLALQELAKAHDAARQADEDFSKKMKAYQDTNLEAIERVLKAEASGRPPTGKDLAVQTAWRKWRDDAAVSAKAVSEARTKLNANRPIAELSLQQGTQSVDVTSGVGELVSKDVTINADVRAPSGETTQKKLVVTMQRAIMTLKDQQRTGRWVISKIAG
jgi:hypothetical protein